MLICHCKVVNDSKIRTLVVEGAKTVGQVGKATGAGTCCGGCVPAIAAVIEAARPLEITNFIPTPENCPIAAE